jgi:hypothetical protein
MRKTLIAGRSFANPRSKQEAPMRIICGWCRTFIKEKIPIDDGKLSHGICKKCADKLRYELKILRRTHKCHITRVVIPAKRELLIKQGSLTDKENGNQNPDNRLL